jgi:uncharacterized membrane protein
VDTSVTAGGGLHAFLWEKGVMTDLGTLGPEFVSGIALAINPRGDLVGANDTRGSESRATLWTRKSPKFAAAG